MKVYTSALLFTCLSALINDASATAIKSEPIQPIPMEISYNQNKAELGKMLFFDPRLSKSGWLSCNSCHNLAMGGDDNRPSSIGHQWQIGPINSPTVLNARFNVAQFWDGRAKDLQEQAGGPIANPKEMASNHQLAIKILQSIPDYQTKFEKVYGDKDISINEVTDAIAEFEKTLITPASRFDQWLLGDDSQLTLQEKEGYHLFKEKGCVACHNGVGVGGNSYQKFGVVKPYEKDKNSLGRYNVTKKEEDKYVFKVPLLRNIELTAPYFHDGSVWSLNEAVSLMADYQLGIKLTDNETNKIVAFLKTLTGKQPEITYPVLPPENIHTPRPSIN